MHGSREEEEEEEEKEEEEEGMSERGIEKEAKSEVGR